MIANVGKLDRVLRFLFGALLFAVGAGFFRAVEMVGAFAWVTAAVGAVMMVTAVLSFCPAYSLFGVNTCSK